MALQVIGLWVRGSVWVKIKLGEVFTQDTVGLLPSQRARRLPSLCVGAAFLLNPCVLPLATTSLCFLRPALCSWFSLRIRSAVAWLFSWASGFGRPEVRCFFSQPSCFFWFRFVFFCGHTFLVSRPRLC